MAKVCSMKQVFVLLLFFVFFQSCLAATIHGELFDWETLERIDNVVIDVNSVPPQRIVAENGFYSFNVEPGTYSIEAMQFVNGELASIAFETVIVESQGTFNLDLVLRNATEQDLEGLKEKGMETTLFDRSWETQAFLFATFFAVAFGAVFWYFRKRKQPKEESFLSVQQKPEPGLDIYANEVLDVLKRSGNRLTQKELRDKCQTCGEAKISLILTELEAMGKVKKIKKGRGNIIVLREP